MGSLARLGLVLSSVLITVMLFPACTSHGGGPPVQPTTTTTHVIVTPDTLPGIQTGPPPWAPELDHLLDRLKVINIPALKQEGAAMDMHVQLSVNVNGQPVTVPSGIGLNGEEVAGGRMVSGFVSPLHSHDASGLIHVHSPTVRDYWIADIFDVWGVLFTKTCIGADCSDGDRAVRVFVNGKEVSDPRPVRLANQQRIVVTYGTPAQLPSPIPSEFGQT